MQLEANQQACAGTYERSDKREDRLGYRAPTNLRHLWHTASVGSIHKKMMY